MSKWFASGLLGAWLMLPLSGCERKDETSIPSNPAPPPGKGDLKQDAALRSQPVKP